MKRKAVRQIEQVGLFWDLELNKERCSLVDIKNFTLGENILEGIFWSNSEVKILGDHFGNNKGNVTEKNLVTKNHKNIKFEKGMENQKFEIVW